MAHYNPLAPVSSIMSTDLVTLSPGDDLWKAKGLFEKHKIHHIPVVRFKDIVGMLSMTDLNLFYRGFCKGKLAVAEKEHMQETRVDEIMTKQLAKLEATDPIRTALEVFKLNRFHALPVVENGDDLIGMITTHDIIIALSEEEIELEDYDNLKE